MKETSLSQWFKRKTSNSHKTFLHSTVFSQHQTLLDEVGDAYALNLYGAHGIEHWESVYRNTQRLANAYSITSDVFIFFALLHDCKREDEDEDFGHGKRAALAIEGYQEAGFIPLSPDDQARLVYACANHTKADKTDPLYQDLVVQICLDADKLDIGRVGIIPHESHFLTEVAKTIVQSSSK
jgi:uncharacterized protein